MCELHMDSRLNPQSGDAVPGRYHSRYRCFPPADAEYHAVDGLPRAVQGEQRLNRARARQRPKPWLLLNAPTSTR